MSAAQETNSSALDGVKWLVVALIVGAGAYCNWYFAEESLLYRVVALIIVAFVAGFIALQTAKGASLWLILKEARIEFRKVVWPTHQETVQTTLLVLVVVVIAAIILWGLDSLLSWLVSGVIG